MASKTGKTDRAREAFLALLGNRCNVSEACRAAGISRATAYRWREESPEFAAAWSEAEETAADALEEMAWNRAQDGSDRMLEILLKGHRPQKYGRTILAGDQAAPLVHKHDMTGLTEAQLEALAALGEGDAAD